MRLDTGRNSEVCAQVCWSHFQLLGFFKEEQLLMSNNQIVQFRMFQSLGLLHHLCQAEASGGRGETEGGGWLGNKLPGGP